MCSSFCLRKKREVPHGALKKFEGFNKSHKSFSSGLRIQTTQINFLALSSQADS